MPRAADRVADDESFTQRTAVMGAGGANRKGLRATAGQKYRFVADLTDEHRIIGKVIFGIPLVGSGLPWFGSTIESSRRRTAAQLVRRLSGQQLS